MFDSYKLQEELPLYDNENIFEEFISPHYSHIVLDILSELKKVYSINFLGHHQTSMFEYLSFSYINGVLKINDGFLNLYLEFYTNFHEQNRHVLTSSPLMSCFELSKKSFEFYFNELKDILIKTKGEFPKWNDDRKNNELFYSYNNCIREIKLILSIIEDIPNHYKDIENI